MATNLFSTYRTGENRVTATILAVLRFLALQRTERLIGAMLEESEFELVRFASQPSAGGAGVPDAEITANFHLLVETKTTANAVNADQLRRHLNRFENNDENQALLLLTPDSSQPHSVDEINDPRLVWSSFSMLNQAIDELLEDTMEVVSEREEFLLRELQAMLGAEGLLRSEIDVVVVPARSAWSIYHTCHAYICQPNRTFRAVGWIAFYTKNQIMPTVPRILRVHEEVRLDQEADEGNLRRIIDAYLAIYPKAKGGSRKVFELTPPDDAATILLNAPIGNDLQSSSGRTTAFTQNQRYVRSERLRSARLTSDLIDGS